MSKSYSELEVVPTLPPKIARLKELANNLVYSWHRETRALFFSLDEALWKACNHNPVLFLRRVDQNTLNMAAKDPEYLKRYQLVLQWYDDYCQTVVTDPNNLLAPNDNGSSEGLIAYFCAEFGLHESLPIYSGGLGILAGDHCKAASDMSLPLVAVGLLYHQGYFTQTIDANGIQQAHYISQDFVNLPVKLLRDQNRREILVNVPIDNHEIDLRIWRVRIGRIDLYLLDSDVSSNSPEDRHITKRLYDGSPGARINQEIVLGIGGVRALRALNFIPTVWHINEGHAAFSILERIREVVATGLPFDIALEQVAAATVFTTHTPVNAGHDNFNQSTLLHHLSRFVSELDMDREKLMALGSTPANPQDFNMTTLGLRGSRFHNGVSRIHGDVAANMEAQIWPEITPVDNPITYITNGVHVESFLDKEWVELLDQQLSDWRKHLANTKYWQKLQNIQDEQYWQCHQRIKKSLLTMVHHQLHRQHKHQGASEALIAHSTRHIEQHQENLLVLGFARRFATYKRATLLFYDHQRLLKLLNHDPPILIIFAGKAHPDDGPGKELIRIIHEYSMQPEFIGKIILLEGYDMALARLLVAGCDIWLNTPEYPMEACGTSGQKAGINGVVNLSVLDGWWAEGYNKENGWAIAPHAPGVDSGYRNRQESTDLLDILEHGVMPAYFDRDKHPYPSEWIKKSKASMSSTIPRFSAERMLQHYLSRLYREASQRGPLLAADNNAVTLADWKHVIRGHWPGVSAERVEALPKEIILGATLSLSVKVKLNNLSPQDLLVECLVGNFDHFTEDLSTSPEKDANAAHCLRLIPNQPDDNDQCLFTLEWTPQSSGLKQYKLRIYPYHSLLSHPFEMGFMIWV